MRTPCISRSAIFLVALLSLVNGRLAVAGEKVKVMSVDSVRLAINADGKVKVEAAGTVNTGGWKQPELVPSKEVPNDGKTHLDLVALRPTSMVTQALVKITDSTVIESKPGKLTVVVHAKRGSVEESLELASQP